MNIFPGDTPSWEKWIVKRYVSLHRPSHEPQVVKMTGAAEIPFVFPPFFLEENLPFFRGHKSQTTPCFTMVKHHVSPSSIRGFHTRHVFPIISPRHGRAPVVWVSAHVATRTIG